MNLQEIGLEGMGWIFLVEDRDQWWLLVNAVMRMQGIS
jgi:hypothetical protein